MAKHVGVVAIQGDFEKHLTAFERAGVPLDHLTEIRTPEDLFRVDRIVIPGGESTTVGKLMQRYGLGDAIIEFARSGHPVWGTCMGLILLAATVEGSDQYSLGLLDVTVRRNAFGAQVHSFEDAVAVEGLETAILGVFIRAPIVTEIGNLVQVIARYEDQVVGVRSGNVIGTSFHPELTDDSRMHEWFYRL